MLLLRRRENESILIGDNVEVKVVRVEGGQVQLGIIAPKEVSVHRQEVYAAILAANKTSSSVSKEDLDSVLNAFSTPPKKKKAPKTPSRRSPKKP